LSAPESVPEELPAVKHSPGIDLGFKTAEGSGAAPFFMAKEILKIL
jgi:hypothetical protein